MSYDYTVLAGTQGIRTIAKRSDVPNRARVAIALVLFAEGAAVGQAY